MSDPDHFFVIKVLISFVVAGIWIAGATLLAERFGSKIGGLITNLPSNILISLIRTSRRAAKILSASQRNSQSATSR